MTPARMPQEGTGGEAWVAPRDPGFAPGVAALALAAVVTHAHSLGAPFFADDWLFLDQTRFHSLFQVLASPDPLGNFFRPLGRQVWFWLLASVSAENPVAFHAANLLCFVVAVVLMARIARRAAGAYAGVVAAGFLALHYAADVPVLWCSGSQELLSLALALGALELHQRERRVAAAVCYFAALLAKEVVLLAPLAAMALDVGGGGGRARARRAWPMGVALLAWAALTAWATARRGPIGAGTALTPAGPLAAPILLVRVALGLEWQTGALPFAHPTHPGAPALLAVAAAGLAVLSAAPARAARPPRARSAAPRRGRAARETRPASPTTTPEPPRAGTGDAVAALRAGLVWALAGALPVAVVAPAWSAYYFLFALGGLALALGALAAWRRFSAPVAAAIVVAAGLASTQARGLEEFATGPSAWSGQSHVNRFYLERGMRVITRGLADLHAAIPHPQPRTSFFFTDLPPFAAFQVADGPLVRGAYRDSSLRGYYLSELSRARVRRGPLAVFDFDAATGRLVDRTRDPGMFISAALGQMLSERLETADAALDVAAASGADPVQRAYLAALVAWARGDSARAIRDFAEAGREPGRSAPDEVARARRQAAAGDTVGALLTLQAAQRRAVLDPELHALAADLLLGRPSSSGDGEIEAFAAHVLAPGSPAAWRRWAFVLAQESRPRQSLAALERYIVLRPAALTDDGDAVRLRALERRMLPGGDLQQREMVKEYAR